MKKFACFAMALAASIMMQDKGDYYESGSGAKYQYDLSRPGDRVRYDVDPGAQLRDSIATDPRIQMDRDMGRNGGGYIRD